MQHVQSLDLLRLPAVAADSGSYKSGQFEADARKVSAQFNSLARELSAVNGELQGRVDSFQKSLSSVKSHVPVILAAVQQQQQQQRQSQSEGIQPAPHMRATADSSLQVLSQHLNEM